MNTGHIINAGLADGKLKFGVCSISTCNNDELLYRVTNGYICGSCLDKVGKVFEAFEAKED